jgi:putative ABC transport system ATP-binding protein
MEQELLSEGPVSEHAWFDSPPRPFLEIRSLRMVYRVGTREIRALAGIDLLVPRGQLLCIRGRSGSGKSSLLHAIAGLRKPTAGRVRVGDIEIQKLTARQSALFRRRAVGIIFQFFNLLPMLTVAENVAFPLSLDGVRSRALDTRVDALLGDLGMREHRDHYPDQLSGGQMQRVAIARALVIEPEVILADEPTGNLDSAASSQIWLLLQGLARQRRVTTIVATHDREAAIRADRIVVLSDGAIIEDSIVGRGPERPLGDSR